jgi:hypothetical protein
VASQRERGVAEGSESFGASWEASPALGRGRSFTKGAEEFIDDLLLETYFMDVFGSHFSLALNHPQTGR